MAPHKRKFKQRISTVLTDDCLHLSLEKLVGESLHTPAYISAQSISESLGIETLDTRINTFIDKFGTTHYETLDELLLAHTTSGTSCTVYNPPKKATQNLFEGLDSLLD